MTSTAEEPHILAGAYVLGSLSAEDHRAFTIHLRSCPRCRTELDELAGLPRLLDLLDPAAVEMLAGSLMSGRPSTGPCSPELAAMFTFI